MPVDPFLKKKWERVFYTFFDTNKNKVIDWNDFELIFEEIKELRGETSTEYKIASDAMGAVWQGLAMETKHLDLIDPIPDDCEITLEEWDKVWQNFNPRKMPIWQWEYLKYMFFLIDTSGDKFIDKDEYTEVMKIYKMSPEDAKAAYDKFAVSADGKTKLDKIDYGRFVSLWAEYFTGDKSKPGSYLFGTW